MLTLTLVVMPLILLIRPPRAHAAAIPDPNAVID
jgi:hypothetical protein